MYLLFIQSVKTEHILYNTDSRDCSSIEDNSVDLVVTSPPYPMIEMWDSLFADLNNEIKTEIDLGNGQEAFELMHSELDKVWQEVNRVITDDGIVCVNIGDATRTIGGGFSLYPNHARVIDTFQNKLGFTILPPIQWKKPTNTGAKFMGSGMRPPNAYVTLEHEQILIFRKSDTPRDVADSSKNRDSSAYFWEERNKWFSDTWNNIKGVNQDISSEDMDDDTRDRSAAYPFMIPYRLINMFSVYGDRVFDPFWGCGTTTSAAVVAGRDSIGNELDDELIRWFESRQIENLSQVSESVISRRLSNHIDHIESKREQGEALKYESDNYNFSVTTSDEVGIEFHTVDEILRKDDGIFVEYNKLQSVDDIETPTTPKKQSTLN